MTKKYKFPFFLLAGLALVLIALVIHYREHIAVLSPKGFIALQERDLIILSTVLMLIIVIPVLVMAPLFAWRYHESNKGEDYKPDDDHNLFAEAVWWGFPTIIVILISILTWESSRELDPFRPLESDTKPLKVQVIALQWKWLFIYPEERIASLNFLPIPVDTPINFQITADAPMNSFWIPQLGGQIYAMPGMETKLHLIADKTGTFRGSSANLSGDGFAKMYFESKAMDKEAFDQWVKTAQNSSPLDTAAYTTLALPNDNNDTPQTFQLKEENLFDQIVMKYMGPTHE